MATKAVSNGNRQGSTPDPYILGFDAPESSNKALVGGKGANLGKLTQAGFPVPPGFNITTAAYNEFVTATGLWKKLSRVLSDINYDDADDLEARTTVIRDLFAETTVPSAIREAIDKHYTRLGNEVYVAVRSSGTAEDLAEASFAGLHDTYLDIRGRDGLIDAVRDCWASLWTSRATAYRHRNGFSHTEAQLAVVIQYMVSSAVSGVMFTGNPVTTATDEIMINASWGLGESVVSGIVTPDTFVLKVADDLHVRDRVLGPKEVTIRRDPQKSLGAVTEPTPEAEQAKYTLSDKQAIELSRLGLRVQEYYDGFPQDIEWGYEDGGFQLLQSRPITGVEFSWDADCEDWQVFDDADDTTWTRSLADENWTGAVSPLMYSCRGLAFSNGRRLAVDLWGFEDMQRLRMLKFRKSTIYFNCDMERKTIEHTIPTAFRQGSMGYLPASWHEEVAAKPFSWFSYAKLYARIETLRPALYKAFKDLTDIWFPKFETEGRGISREDLPSLTDSALKRYVNKLVAIEDDYIVDVYSWYIIQARDVLTFLRVMLQHWYDPEDATAFQAVLSGTPRRSETMKQNHMLWELSHMIRVSETLSATFTKHKDGGFFAACKDTDDGRKFLEHYKLFIERYGQRGHPDRDVYFPRRCEDPMIDYLALEAMLKTAESTDPEIKEIETNSTREEFVEKVIAKIQRGLFGTFKAELFKLVLDWAINFVISRDDERHYLDLCSLSIRWGFMEVGRRLAERGIFESVDDVWFLTRSELYALLDSGSPMKPLTRAKITARRRDFERMLEGAVNQPPYLVNYKGVDLDDLEEVCDGIVRGIGTAVGSVTARARVVRRLKDVGKVQEGDILVVNSTDPGWTPVFHIISGLVLETGGILAHGSCLAREYGLPSVQVARAMQLIPDGALVTVNGDRGTVTILEEHDKEGPAISNGTG
ncbi:Pyruvate, water dikinase [Coniochaeta sp. 2T2.1]|nr:Pyruvate, water dikinase [Coniochaeta sp. 2T2.1]